MKVRRKKTSKTIGEDVYSNILLLIHSIDRIQTRFRIVYFQIRQTVMKFLFQIKFHRHYIIYTVMIKTTMKTMFKGLEIGYERED